MIQMSILFVLIVACFLWGVRINRSGLNADYLSIENTTAFRGILSVLVACYHLAQNTWDRSLFHLFVFFGFLPVAYFFFLSGYGLQKSYAQKQNYRSRILKKRIPSILLPYLFFVVLYWLLSWYNGDPYSLREVLRSIVGRNSIVMYSWYVQFILLLYLGYYGVTAWFRGNHMAIPAWNLLLVLGAVFVFQKLEFGYYWYITCITYPLGILWAIKEQSIISWIKKRYFPLLTAAVIGFAAVFVATLLYSQTHAFLWLYWFSSVLFVLAALLLQMKITFKNKLLLILGRCSLEIYMIHGLFIDLYRGANIYMADPLVWSAAVLLSSCLCAYGLNKAFHAVLENRWRGPRKMKV